METTPTAAALFMVEVRVRDLGRSLDWYGRTLGLRPRLVDEPGGFALLDAGPAAVALKAGGEAPADRRGVRLTFRVADVEAERARIAELGVAVSEPIVNEAEGFREVRLADPDGTPITLFAWDRGPQADSTGST